jgi:hypothetical protein
MNSAGNFVLCVWTRVALNLYDIRSSRQFVDKWNALITYRIWGSHSGGYDEYYLLEYNAV